MADEFSIEAKLKIAGVETPGELDAGKLKFDVDTSALKNVVSEATDVAKKVKEKFDNLKLNKLTISLNENSLTSIKTKLRDTLQAAVGEVDFGAVGKGKAGKGQSKGGENPFNAQAKAAAKSADSLGKLHELTKTVNTAFRSLIRTLDKGIAGGGAKGGKPRIKDEPSLPITPGTKFVGASAITAGGQSVTPESIEKAKAAHEQLFGAQKRGIQEVDGAKRKSAQAVRESIDKETKAAIDGLNKRARQEEAHENKLRSRGQARIRQQQKIFKDIFQNNQRVLKGIQDRRKAEQAAATQEQRNIDKSNKAARAAAQERINNINKIKRELDAAFQKEQQMTARFAGGGRGGFGGGVPPGGFGATPPGGDFDKSRGDIRKFSDGLRQVSMNARNANKQVEDLDELAFQVGRKAAAFRGVAIAINSIIQSLQAALKFVVEFNDSLQEVNKILQLSTQGLQRLGDQVFELSRRTGVAVEETFKITEAFARAGLSGRGFGSVVQLTERALQGFQGTTMDAVQASTLMIQIIQQLEGGARGLQKELITTSKLFDILGRVEDITASKAQDFAEAFRRSGASLVATGASLEEIAGLVAVVQERTQRGGTVIGTAFKTIATRIASPASEASKALASIGVETVTTEGNLRNISDVIRDTAVAFKGLTESEQASIATKVAGVRQIEIFRNAVLDFGRVLEVQREAQTASGDAARKASIEQEKLSVVLNRVQLSLQKLIKTATEGPLGTIFDVVVRGADKILSVITSADKALGGMVSNFAALSIGIAAVKILGGLFSGMFKTVKFFIGGMKESAVGVQGVGKAAQSAKSGGVDPMNASFQASVELIAQMNQQMQAFMAAQEAAAARADRMRLAHEQASAQSTVSPLDPAARQADVDKRAKKILRDQDRPALTARRATIAQAAREGRARELKQAADRLPGTFDAAEAAAINKLAAREAENAAKSTGRFGKVLGKLNRPIGFINKKMDFLRKHTFAVAAGAGIAGSLISELGQSMQEAGSSAVGLGVSMLGVGAQFASFGALFGPWGIAIGFVAGAITSLVQDLNKNKTTIDELRKEYLRLGIVQEENGQITDESAERLEKAFRNIKAFQDFEAAQERRAAAEEADPQAGKAAQAARRKQIDTFGKDLVAALDLEGLEKENIERVQKLLSGITKTQFGGEGFDFTAPEKSFEAATFTTRQAMENLFQDLAKSAEKASGKAEPGLRKAIRKVFQDAIPGGIGSGSKEEIRKRITELQRGFLDQLHNVIPSQQEMQDLNFFQRLGQVSGEGGLFGAGGLLGTEELLPARKTGVRLAGLARGQVARGSEGEQKLIGELRAEARAGKVPGLPAGAKGVEGMNKLITAAQETNRLITDLITVREKGKEGVLLARAARELPKVLVNFGKKTGVGEAAETRAKQLQDQLQAIAGLTQEREAFPTGLADAIAKPVNKLEIALREFANKFADAALSLQQATLRATTPQKELATAMRQQARVELDVARSRADVTAGDVRSQIATAVQALGPGTFAIGRGESLQPGQEGPIRPGFTKEDADITRNQLRQALLDGIFATRDEVVKGGIVDPAKLREILSKNLQETIKIPLPQEEFKKLLDSAGEGLASLMKSLTGVQTATSNLNRTTLAEFKFLASERLREASIASQRREIAKTEAQVGMQQLTGIRALIKARDIEATVLQGSIDATKSEIAVLDEAIRKANQSLEINKKDVAASDVLNEATKKRTLERLKLDKLEARSAVDTAKAKIAAQKEAISNAQKEIAFMKSQRSGRRAIADLLQIGGKQIEKFNEKLKRNKQDLKDTTAELAARAKIISETVKDEGEKKAQLAEITKLATKATLDAAKAEAEIIKARREAIKKLTEEALGNTQKQVEAQKGVIEATQRVSEVFEQYRQSVDGVILATTQYNLNLSLAEAQAKKVTGSFSGMRDEIIATQNIFRDAENAARDMGASEKTLVEIRRQSIDAQLALFNQLLSEQTSLAQSFFTSSAQDQADLALGINEAQQIADLLGGSFDNFKSKSDDAINDLGAQLLSLPQETRQRIAEAVDTLDKLGFDIGGFTADELRTAIQDATRGRSEDQDVDPLFKIQERIAQLTEEQARLATEQLLAANESVTNSKAQLEEAEAAKDLAEIQLERIKEEGEKLRGKIGELRGSLNTTILKQTATNKTGLSMVGAAVNRVKDAIVNTLPDSISVKIGQAFREALEASGTFVKGISDQGPKKTAGDRGVEDARNMRKVGSNESRQRTFNASSGNSIVVSSQATDKVPVSTSNNPRDDSTQKTNSILDDILDGIKSLVTGSEVSNTTLEEIKDQDGTTGGVTTAATQPVEFNVNVEGTQTVTVTGFEAGVSRVAQALAESFGGFATEAEAEQAARQIIEPIVQELVNRGIIQRNQAGGSF